MENKGFTLIELLAIFIILPLLLIIAYPSIRSYLDKTRLQYYEILEENVRLAAIDFTADNKNFLPKGIGNFKRISVEQIVKYIEMEQITDEEGKACENGYVVIEKKDTANYEYTSCLTCGSYKTANSNCKKNET